jgi:hypothetical protein
VYRLYVRRLWVGFSHSPPVQLNAVKLKNLVPKTADMFNNKKGGDIDEIREGNYDLIKEVLSVVI